MSYSDSLRVEQLSSYYIEQRDTCGPTVHALAAAQHSESQHIHITDFPGPFSSIRALARAQQAKGTVGIGIYVMHRAAR